MEFTLKGKRLSGTEIEIAASELSALHVVQSGSRFEEAVERGNVYFQSNQTTTVTQAGLSATTPALAIGNRLGSGKVVKLWYAGAAGLVAAGAGAVIWLAMGGFSVTDLATVTDSNVRNAKTGDGTLPAGIDCADISTLPAAPIAIAILGGRGGAAAITTAPWFAPAARWFDGALAIREGYNISIQTSTADTLFCDFIFEVQDA